MNIIVKTQETYLFNLVTECGRGIIGVAGVALARSIDNSRNKVRTFMYDKTVASKISIIDETVKY